MIPADAAISPWSPYRVETFPRSKGRVLLGEALASYVGLVHGLAPMDIAQAFAPGGDARDRELVATAVRFLGGLLLEGRFTTYARPMGGGEPVRLDPGMWELDDFTARFATCTLDPRRPFDAGATPTHRIFMDEADLDALMAASCVDAVPVAPVKASRQTPASPNPVSEDQVLIAGDPALYRRIRLPELEELVGLSRSTIYSRIADGRFPAGEKDGERITYWRESVVREWLAGSR